MTDGRPTAKETVRDMVVPQLTPRHVQAPHDDMEPLQVLQPDGTLATGAVPGMTPDQQLESFRWMVFSRTFDEKAFALQRQGRFGTFSPVAGQEASVVGSALALDPTVDWIVPQYREIPAIVRHGYPLRNLLLYFIGNPAGGHVPDGVNMLPIQISLAAQLPHAVGLAWGLQLQHRPGVVTVYFGDGASSEGDFHEALNLAGILRAPVVFFLQNNGWAISTPRSKQSAARHLASRAQGYGIPGELVDGNDIFAVHEATVRAVERARSGGGATLIESETYRMWAHNTADDASRYVPEPELREQAQLDPLARLRTYLTAQGLLTDADEAQMREEAAALIASTVAEVEQLRPGPGQLFDHVYAEDHPRLARQRAGSAEHPQREEGIGARPHHA